MLSLSTPGAPLLAATRFHASQINRLGISKGLAWDGRSSCFTVIGKGHQGALVTLDERKSKLRLAFPVANKSAEAVTASIITLLAGFKEWVHTLTFDNGKEFNLKVTSAKHEQVAHAIKCATYFAKPYHSWERRQNENANGLLH
jgi:IS30 family transposase